MGWELICTNQYGTPLAWYFDVKEEFYDALNSAHKLLEYGFALQCRQIAEHEARAAEARSGGTNDAQEFRRWAHEQHMLRHGR